MYAKAHAPTQRIEFEEVGWLGTAYGVTMPAAFEPTAPAPAPFEERLGGGLAVREVRELDVFRLFFDENLEVRARLSE